MGFRTISHSGSPPVHLTYYNIIFITILSADIGHGRRRLHTGARSIRPYLDPGPCPIFHGHCDSFPETTVLVPEYSFGFFFFFFPRLLLFFSFIYNSDTHTGITFIRIYVYIYYYTVHRSIYITGARFSVHAMGRALTMGHIISLYVYTYVRE